MSLPREKVSRRGSSISPIAIALAALALLAGCRSIDPYDEQPPVTESHRVPWFSSIRLVGQANVEIEVGPLRSVLVEAHPQQIRQVSFEMRSDELEIHTSWRMDSRTTRPLVRVTLPRVDAIRHVGVGDITVTGSLITSDFEIYHAGRGRIKVTTGTVDLLAARSLRSGVIDAEGLTAFQVHGRINGSGDITVFAIRSLNADNTGRGVMTVHGGPVERRVKRMGREVPEVRFVELPEEATAQSNLSDQQLSASRHDSLTTVPL